MKKIVFGMVTIVALIALVLMVKTSGTGQASYQQVLHRDNMVYVDYNLCKQVECGLGMSALYIGDERLTGNALCQCPNGRILQIDKRGQY